MRFEFLPMNDQILQQHLTILSPLNYFYTFVKNQLGIFVWMYFWLLYCVPLIYGSILPPVPPSPYLYIVLKSNTLILCNLFFFKIILTILVSLTPKEGRQICYCWKRVSISAPQVTSSDIWWVWPLYHLAVMESWFSTSPPVMSPQQGRRRMPHYQLEVELHVPHMCSTDTMVGKRPHYQPAPYLAFSKATTVGVLGHLIVMWG